MSDVKRWLSMVRADGRHQFVERVDGDWINATDHDRVVAELKATTSIASESFEQWFIGELYETSSCAERDVIREAKPYLKQLWTDFAVKHTSQIETIASQTQEIAELKDGNWMFDEMVIARAEMIEARKELATARTAIAVLYKQRDSLAHLAGNSNAAFVLVKMDAEIAAASVTIRT